MTQLWRRNQILLCTLSKKLSVMENITNDFVAGTWIRSTQNTKVTVATCAKKTKKKRTNCYCTCNVARWMCYDCFCDHIVSVAKKVGANRSTTDAAAHRLLTAPNHSRTYDEQTDCWIKTNKDKYQKYNCHTCKNCRIRTYCSCQPGVWMCPGCHQKHVLAFCTNNSFPT